MERAGDRHGLPLSAGQPLDGAIGVADVDLQPREVTRRRVPHRALVQDAHAGHQPPGELGPHEHVLPDGKPGGEGEILVDRRHAGAQRIDRRAEDDRAPVDLDAALARFVRARDDADQRRLAGAVVAADRDHFTGVDVEIDAGAAPRPRRSACRSRRGGAAASKGWPWFTPGDICAPTSASGRRSRHRRAPRPSTGTVR